MPASDAVELLIRLLAANAPLDATDRAAIRALPITIREVEALTYLVREGEPPPSCAVLMSGFAFRQKLTGNGGRSIVSLHIPGDMLDLQHLFLDIADHNVQSLTRATLAMIPRAALQALIRERPAINQAMLFNLLIEASIFREWIVNIGRRDGRTRLAHLLCELAARLEARGLTDTMGYELPMTQEQLGDALGLTPVHVNRMMKVLEDQGYITRSKRDISFPQWKMLRDVADFNARYLHLNQHYQP